MPLSKQIILVMTDLLKEGGVNIEDTNDIRVGIDIFYPIPWSWNRFTETRNGRNKKMIFRPVETKVSIITRYSQP